MERRLPSEGLCKTQTSTEAPERDTDGGVEQIGMLGKKLGERYLLLKRLRGAALQRSLAFDWLLIVCRDVDSGGSIGVEERMS